MLNIKKLSFTNVLSSGNKENVFDFENGTTTLIVGINGSGKSQFYEALFFCLYGKPFRKIKKEQLVNSINKKKLLTMVELSTGKHDVKIIRGIRPNTFEIWVDGKLKESEAAVRDQQQYLTNNILKISESTFRQIIILGSNAYVPFMLLNNKHRNIVINDLLDLEIFGTMLGIARKRLTIYRQELKEIQTSVLSLQIMIENKKNQIEELKEAVDDESKDIEKELSCLKSDIAALNESYHIQSDRMMKLDISNLNSNKSKEKESINRIIEIKAKMKSKQTTYKKEIKFFEDNDRCPTCEQHIEGEWKVDKLHECNNQLSEIENYKSKIEDMATEIEERVSQINAEIESFNDIKAEALDINNKIKTKKVLLKQIENQKSKMKDGANNKALLSIEKELDDLEKEIKEYKARGRTSLIDNKNHEIILDLLKDTGLKAQIIETYLPIINKLIQDYLDILEFPISFSFDNEFNEVIKARGRDHLSYGNFSAGEKMRIDLCLLFTWRKLASIKNAAQCNLLILDEIGDSSLDSTGLSGFNKILKSSRSEQCTMIISHNTDNLSGIDKVIKVEKIGNFSTYRTD